MTFRTKYNFDPVEAIGEINEEPSMTVPDMNYTVREMLDKFVRGHELPVRQSGQFDDEDDLESWEVNPLNLGSYDLTDLTEMQLELEANLSEIKRARSDLAQKEAQKADEKLSDEAKEE